MRSTSKLAPKNVDMQMSVSTLKQTLLSKEKCLFIQPTISTDNFIISPDLMLVNRSKISLYHVSVSYNPLSAGIDTLAFYSYVLKSLGFSINTVCIFTINSSYKKILLRKISLNQTLYLTVFLNVKIILRNYVLICSEIWRLKNHLLYRWIKHVFKPQLCDHFKNLLAKFFVMGYFFFEQ